VCLYNVRVLLGLLTTQHRHLRPSFRGLGFSTIINTLPLGTILPAAPLGYVNVKKWTKRLFATHSGRPSMMVIIITQCKEDSGDTLVRIRSDKTKKITSPRVGASNFGRVSTLSWRSLGRVLRRESVHHTRQGRENSKDEAPAPVFGRPVRSRSLTRCEGQS